MIIYPAPGCEPRSCQFCEGNYIVNFVDDATCLYADSDKEAIQFCETYADTYDPAEENDPDSLFKVELEGMDGPAIWSNPKK